MIARARAIAAHAAVRAEPAASKPLAGEPPDLGALFAVTDGIELADGTRILSRAEIAPATAWLVGEKALEWGADLWVIGERDDLVIVRDLDESGARAGGGVIEAPTDGLGGSSRAALDVIGYLEDRLGIAGDREIAPERALRGAVARRDADGIERALGRSFYPGAGREAAQGWLTLGAIRAAGGDAAGALDAFGAAAEVRARAAPRGAEASERAASWRAAAIAADRAGARDVAEACHGRG